MNNLNALFRFYFLRCFLFLCLFFVGEAFAEGKQPCHVELDVYGKKKISHNIEYYMIMVNTNKISESNSLIYIKELINHGCDVNAVGSGGLSLINTSILFCLSDIYALLLKHGASIDAKISGVSSKIEGMDAYDYINFLIDKNKNKFNSRYACWVDFKQNNFLMKYKNKHN